MDIRYLGRQTENNEEKTSFSVEINTVNQGFFRGFRKLKLVTKLPPKNQ